MVLICRQKTSTSVLVIIKANPLCTPTVAYPNYFAVISYTFRPRCIIVKEFSTKRHRQLRYNVTMGRVCELFLSWKSNKYYIFFCACARAGRCVWVPRLVGVSMRARACRLAYPACKAYTPYVTCGIRLYHILRHYLINGTIFFKKRY